MDYNINPINTPDVSCEECGNILFEKVTILKKVSKLLIGATKDEIVPIETYMCKSCGHINKDFNFKEKKDDNK